MSRPGLMQACMISLFAILATGCSIDRAPIIVEGKLIDRAGNPSQDLPVDASAIRRQSKIIMGAPVYDNQTTRSSRYVSVVYQAEGAFTAQAYRNSNALVLAVPGHSLLRKDVSSTRPQKNITFYRSERGILLEITPDD